MAKHRIAYIFLTVRDRAISSKFSTHRVSKECILGNFQKIFPSPQPQVDLFATRFNNKLSQFVSPVPDSQAWAVAALSLSWEDLDPYAFPPAAILGKVVEKLQDYPCNRIILFAPGWPNMPWFWDLVAMSSQIPLCLPNIPNLVSQPFNQVLHRNLSDLNLHAWLLEPQQSRSKASLRQWQHELRLLKEDQPDLSMRQSGPFLQSGVSVIRRIILFLFICRSHYQQDALFLVLHLLLHKTCINLCTFIAEKKYFGGTTTTCGSPVSSRPWPIFCCATVIVF